MTNFQPQQVIKVKDKAGILVAATLLELLDLPMDERGAMWWASVIMNGVNDVRVYYQADLERWNKYDENECDCGSKRAKQPGHSMWCRTNELI